MFDIGFWEIATIGVIALLVVGPERLPGLARNVGRWVGRTRRYVNHVKQDIEREIHADEVRELLEKPEGLESIRDVARETSALFEDTRKELNSAINNADAGADTGGDTSPDKTTDAVEVGVQASSRRMSHRAVDDDPFAPASIDNGSSGVTPAASPSELPGELPGPLTPPQESTDAATSSDPPADEKRTEQPGQR